MPRTPILFSPYYRHLNRGIAAFSLAHQFNASCRYQLPFGNGHLTITERLNLQFRVQAFNVFNHANFSYPNPIVFSGNAIGPSAGVITQTNGTSRQLQFALKPISEFCEGGFDEQYDFEPVGSL